MPCYQSDTLHLREQRYEDEWLLFKAIGGPRTKNFEEHGRTILGLFRHFAAYMVSIVEVINILQFVHQVCHLLRFISLC